MSDFQTRLISTNVQSDKTSNLQKYPLIAKNVQSAKTYDLQKRLLAKNV